MLSNLACSVLTNKVGHQHHQDQSCQCATNWGRKRAHKDWVKSRNPTNNGDDIVGPVRAVHGDLELSFRSIYSEQEELIWKYCNRSPAVYQYVFLSYLKASNWTFLALRTALGKRWPPSPEFSENFFTSKAKYKTFLKYSIANRNPKSKFEVAYHQIYAALYAWVCCQRLCTSRTWNFISCSILSSTVQFWSSQQ